MSDTEGSLPSPPLSESAIHSASPLPSLEREFLRDNPLVQFHFIIERSWWTGLAPSSLPSSLHVARSVLQSVIEYNSSGGVRAQVYLAHRKTHPPRTLQ